MGQQGRAFWESQAPRPVPSLPGLTRQRVDRAGLAECPLPVRDDVFFVASLAILLLCDAHRTPGV